MWISLSFHLGHWFDSFSTVGLRNSLRANKKGWGRQRDFTFHFQEKRRAEERAEQAEVELLKEGTISGKFVHRFRGAVRARISRYGQGVRLHLLQHRNRGTAAFIVAQISLYGCTIFEERYGCIYFLHKNRGTAWVYGLYDSARVSRDCTASFNAVRPVCWHKFRGTVRLSFCWTVALNVGTEIEKNGLLNIFPDCWWR